MKRNPRLSTSLKEKNDVVTRAAKLIDPEAFHPWTWVDGTGPNAKPVREPRLLRARQAFRRAEARTKAIAILALAAKTPDLAHVLAEIEKDDWERLGAQVRGNEELERIIEDKYPTSRKEH